MSGESLANFANWISQTPNFLATLALASIVLEFVRMIREVVGSSEVRGLRSQLKGQHDLIKDQHEFIKQAYLTLLGKI